MAETRLSVYVYDRQLQTVPFLSYAIFAILSIWANFWLLEVMEQKRYLELERGKRNGKRK